MKTTAQLLDEHQWLFQASRNLYRRLRKSKLVSIVELYQLAEFRERMRAIKEEILR